MPKVGETVRGNAFEKNYGGKGANQAVQCARLGVSTVFIGAVGEDGYGSDYVQAFSKESIDTQYIQSISGSNTGIATIWVDDSGKNSIIIIPGANLKFNGDVLDDILPSLSKAKLIMFQNEISEDVTKKGLKLAQELGIFSIFNPAPVSPACRDMLGLCDILCVNEVELSTLANLPVSSMEEIGVACEALLASGCKYILATLGEQGAMLVSADHSQYIVTAPKVSAVDSVGAGDSFLGKWQQFLLVCSLMFDLSLSGCLAAHIARGVSIQDAIHQAVQCASLSVQSKGAQPSYKHLSELPQAHHPPSRVSQ